MDLKKELEKYFGFSEFKNGQEEIISNLISGKNCLVTMPTGAGKSLCYQLPAMILGGGAIVISPLIALMKDQAEALKKKNIPANFINSTIGKKEKEKRLNDFIDGKIKLLYVTPERFRNKDFAEGIKKAKISLLAVDEAHCISEWGHDFRPDYSRIAEFRSLIGNPLVIALTATATPAIRKDIIAKLGLEEDEAMQFNYGIERPNLKLETADVYDNGQKLNEIFKAVNQYSGPGIIYFSLIKTLDEFSELFDKNGIKHYVYHGKLDTKTRKRMQNDFMKSDGMIVLATNAFGMGIDKPGIRFVIHAEIPGSVESYYQEIGRAGRDGKESLCLMLYRELDLEIQMSFIRHSNPGANYYKRLYAYMEENMRDINAFGLEYLRGQMAYKDKNDRRLETALGMLDRFNAIEGNIEAGNLKLTGEIPELLFDEAYAAKKLTRDQKRLLGVVNYFKTHGDKKEFLNEYFGVEKS